MLQELYYKSVKLHFLWRYIQAATSAKDIVILLDTSGSMKGLSMDIARETVKKIVETLNDDDYFNIIQVFNIFSCANHKVTRQSCC